MSEDVYQQPLLSGVRFEGNFFRTVENCFIFRKLSRSLNSLPAFHLPPTSTNGHPKTDKIPADSSMFLCREGLVASHGMRDILLFFWLPVVGFHVRVMQADSRNDLSSIFQWMR